SRFPYRVQRPIRQLQLQSCQKQSIPFRRNRVERKNLVSVFCLALVCCVTFTAFAGGQDQAAASQTFRGVNGKPVFVVIPRGNAEDAMAEGFVAANIPMWSGSFKVGTTTFNFTMIGTNPASGNATTSVPVVIVPIRFHFANGDVLSPAVNACNDTATPITRIMNSPLLKNSAFTPG